MSFKNLLEELILKSFKSLTDRSFLCLFMLNGAVWLDYITPKQELDFFFFFFCERHKEFIMKFKHLHNNGLAILLEYD